VTRSIAEACAETRAAFAPLGEERLSLLSALGRYTVRPILARSDSPAFDHSAMDGYAVRASELDGVSPEAPRTLAVEGESRAGGPVPGELRRGCAMRIFTGAPMPGGADAVVLQEDAVRAGEQVALARAPVARENVRTRASDLAQGALALRARAHVGAGEIALLASQELASVDVFKRPRVAILCTGDELRDLGEPARPGSIVNSNAYALAAQVMEAGGEPWVLPREPDDRELSRQAIARGLLADVLVLSGGVSVGDYDLVRTALADAGVNLAFWKVHMKPGKPVSFGQHGRVPVIGLPGNPVSAFVGFELFVRPGLRVMLGDPAPERPRLSVRLAAPLARKAGRPELIRVRLTRQQGALLAQPAARQGSGSLPSLVDVDALVLIPGELEHVSPERELEAILLRPLPS
jgi:molybdopterin molybdotransferase